MARSLRRPGGRNYPLTSGACLPITSDMRYVWPAVVVLALAAAAVAGVVAWDARRDASSARAEAERAFARASGVSWRFDRIEERLTTLEDPELTDDAAELVECVPDLQRQIGQLADAIRLGDPVSRSFGAVDQCELALEFGAIEFATLAGAQGKGAVDYTP